MRRRGFTLIELVVVVGVVGVLVVLIAPSLAGARGSAQMVTGASNVRQLMLANRAYAGDFDGFYVPGAAGFVRENLSRWHGGRGAVGERFEWRRGPMVGYLEGEGVRWCPRFAPVLDELAIDGAGFELGCGGYGYNNAFVGTRRERAAGWDGTAVWRVADDRSGSRVSRFRRPSGTVGFGDAAFAAERVVEYSFVEPAWWPDIPGFRPDPSVHFRHVGGRANVAWLDGRVSQEVMSETGSSGIFLLEAGYAAIGWFGDAGDNRVFDYE